MEIILSTAFFLFLFFLPRLSMTCTLDARLWARRSHRRPSHCQRKLPKVVVGEFFYPLRQVVLFAPCACRCCLTHGQMLRPHGEPWLIRGVTSKLRSSMGAGAKRKKLVEKLKHQFHDQDICSNQNVAPVACLIGRLAFPLLPFYHFPNW